MTNPRSDRVRMVAALARRSARSGSGRFLVEGPAGCRELVRYAAEQVVDLYVTPAARERYPEIVEPAQAAGCYVHEATDEVLAAMADADTPQGLIAVARWRAPSLGEILDARPRLLVLLAQVRDPGNAGTVIRAADAAGADAVLLTANSVDVLSPKVVRSTAGSLFHLPVVAGLDTTATLARLRSASILTYAADGRARHTVEDVALTAAHAWVLGNESWGLPPEVAEACDDVVAIPMYGKAESLNLAMAATVCLFASARALPKE